ncbi:sulfotransferase family protein [Mycolicibacterium holsaticum]|uniref:sulfotransferase family protein n=1 Tax=Mycolicibacterium holsaticum TaxID=152142 RepID=UPI001C7D9AC6|nr:sulfotransferase [Mycolicibacterium holsaticum]QZA10816.1 sulfotransferase [Mycolicibacterium holsaticum DSM 44478 = JCM 12374]UNC11685.1 sulfotransferase [Mycolicibacterium holsaticum DSM 44478 = JCM 12374]
MAGFDADDIMASAVELAGSEDFGPPDFRTGLITLCASVDEEAQLNDLGDMAMRQNMIGGLVNRLKVFDWVRQHPDIAAEPVEAPLVVIGLFRAGTTFVSELLDQDRANRSLLRWEAADSVPPPNRGTLRAGPRVDAAAAGIDMLESLNPKIKVVHHEDAAGPTECLTLLGQDFKSLTWEAIANVPGYSGWLLGADQRSAYEYHRTVLQVLQSNGVRGRWTLKSPHHATALDALTAVYPDAHLVVLHRDPTVLCASACSLISTLTGTFSDADHTSYIAEHWTRMLEVSIERIEEFRRAHPERRIIDVQYADLAVDPVGTVAAIYAGCGRELSPAARAAVCAYVDAHPRGRFGAHGYRLEDYGLDQGQIRERFADYVERYNVPTEATS